MREQKGQTFYFFLCWTAGRRIARKGAKMKMKMTLCGCFFRFFYPDGESSRCSLESWKIKSNLRAKHLVFVTPPRRHQNLT